MEDIAMKKKKDRILNFLEFAYETDIARLKVRELWQLKNHLIKILDPDLISYLTAHYPKQRKILELPLRDDLRLLQKGFYAFLEQHFRPLTGSRKHSGVSIDTILYPSRDGSLTYISGILRFEEDVKDLHDIGKIQICRLLSVGIPSYRYYICNECGKWQLNTRKSRKHWICAPCYKKKYDRELKRKERSTPEGRAAYRKYQKERYRKKYRKKCGV